MICPRSYGTPLFCIVFIEPKSSDVVQTKHRSSLMIWRDQVDDESYRRLCRVIRLVRKDI